MATRTLRSKHVTHVPAAKLQVGNRFVFRDGCICELVFILEPYYNAVNWNIDHPKLGRIATQYPADFLIEQVVPAASPQDFADALRKQSLPKSSGIPSFLSKLKKPAHTEAMGSSSGNGKAPAKPSFMDRMRKAQAPVAEPPCPLCQDTGRYTDDKRVCICPAGSKLKRRLIFGK